jgi:hypothetical protein
MNRRRIQLACSILLLALAGPAPAADVTGCLRIVAKAGADAALANGCIDWLNVMYCIDGGPAGPPCADTPKDVITLQTEGVFTVSGFDGRNGTLRSAVCAYPEAPVGWEPARSDAHTCKKTCVMC